MDWLVRCSRPAKNRSLKIDATACQRKIWVARHLPFTCFLAFAVGKTSDRPGLPPRLSRYLWAISIMHRCQKKVSVCLPIRGAYSARSPTPGLDTDLSKISKSISSHTHFIGSPPTWCISAACNCLVCRPIHILCNFRVWAPAARHVQIY